MNELAQKLKDAGFKGIVTLYRSADGETLSSMPFEGYTPEVQMPYLHELIEACGEGEFQLKRTKLWHAVIQKGDFPDHNWQHGTSPEEAVALLWLAINSKE